MTQLTGKNIIGHQLVLGDGKHIHSFNPNTNEQLSPGYAEVGDKDFDKACQLAWDAFLVYKDISREQRAEFLEKAAEEIDKLGDELTQRAMQETGLPQARLEGERGRTCGQLRLFASVLKEGNYLDVRIDKALPDRTPLPRPDLRYYKTGLGPVAVFGASNFPLAFSVGGGDTASALAAGCPVIVKAHSAHVGTSELVGQAIQRAAKRCNMPEGVFSLVYGSGRNVGQRLVEDSRIKAVGFTGSRAGGVALMNTANKRPEPIPVYAEMSSINPVYITQSALKTKGEAIAKGLIDAMMMGAGQFCTSPGLVFAPAGSDLNDFLQVISSYVSEKSSQTMLTSGIYDAFCQGSNTLSKLEGVDIVNKAGQEKSPNQCSPIVFKTTAKILQTEKGLFDEVFGSSVIIVSCDSEAQMSELSETLEGQLTAAIHLVDDENTPELKQLVSVLERKAGRVLFNGFGTGVEVCDAMVHGGPFPATSDSRTTSVGSAAIDRFLRPVCYQNTPNHLLPKDLQS